MGDVLFVMFGILLFSLTATICFAVFALMLSWVFRIQSKINQY